MKLSIEELRKLIKNSKLDYRRKNIIGECPKCGGNEFGISVEENHLFGCFRKRKCGWEGNIFTLLNYLKITINSKLEQEIDILDSAINLKLINKILQSNEEVGNTINTINTIKPPIGWKRVFSNTYLDSRKFIEYDKYQVGVTNLDRKLLNYIIFLVEEQNEIKGYIGRHIWDKQKLDSYNRVSKLIGRKELPRYRNSNTDFSKLLFGINEVKPGVTDTIILVEGIFDKFNVDRLLNLHTQNSIKCLATFKCKISDQQILKLKQLYITNIILLYDNDVIHNIQTTGIKLLQEFDTLISFNDSINNDPGAMNSDELHFVLEEKNLFHPNLFFMKKIQKNKLNL